MWHTDDTPRHCCRNSTARPPPCPHLTRAVEAVGHGVTSLQPGDRVAIEPGVPCCAQHPLVRQGRYNLAPITFFATPPHHGCLAEVC